MTSHTLAEQSLSAKGRRSYRSTALSARSGFEIVSKTEVQQEKARRTTKKRAKAEIRSELASRTVEKPTAIDISPSKLGEAVRREHLAWLRWADRADKSSGGLKKARKKRKSQSDGPPYKKSRWLQGGLPTLGKGR
jgi:hypothetical protein